MRLLYSMAFKKNLFAGIACVGLGVAGVAHAQNSGDVGASAREVTPGRSTRSDVESLLGKPWRVVQFNDCGMAMDNQADETWEYRGTAVDGSYRIHVEFGDNGVVHLIAKIPDQAPGGKPVAARVTQAAPIKGMSM